MQLKYPKFPYGTNYAVHVERALAVGGFREDLGRVGRRLIAGEEGELCLRLEKTGWTTWFEPAAEISHRTSAGRLSRRYILRRAWHHGRSQACMEQMHGFESGRYPAWGKILASLAGRTITFRLSLPYLKYMVFRMGYRWQRSLARPPQNVPQDAHAADVDVSLE
jgi:GT2 family glycosyltransferase